MGVPPTMEVIYRLHGRSGDPARRVGGGPARRHRRLWGTSDHRRARRRASSGEADQRRWHAPATRPHGAAAVTFSSRDDEAAQLKQLAARGIDVHGSGRADGAARCPWRSSREPRAGNHSCSLWGTLVGLDLVSVPQAMIARPLVAGARGRRAAWRYWHRPAHRRDSRIVSVRHLADGRGPLSGVRTGDRGCRGRGARVGGRARDRTRCRGGTRHGPAGRHQPPPDAPPQCASGPAQHRSPGAGRRERARAGARHGHRCATQRARRS